MNNVVKKVLPLVLIILAGIAGAVLRGMELVRCYDDKTGLYTAGTATYALLGFCCVMLLLCAVLAYVKKSGKQSYLALYRCGAPGTMIAMLSGVVMTVAGFIYVVAFFSSGKYSSLLFGVLTVLCGVSLLALSVARKTGTMPDMTGFGAVVMVFWACFMLIQVFMEHPVEPVKLLYLYDLLAMCCALLSIYCATGQLFDRNRPRLALFSSLSAVFLLTVSALGRFLTFFYTGNTQFIAQVDSRLVVYAALLLYCISNAASLLLNLKETAEDELPE